MRNSKKLVSILAGLMAAIMLLTLIISLLPTKASAASSSEIRKQINSLEEQRQDMKSQISDLKAQYQANSDEIADIISRKNIIDQEIGSLYAQMTNLNEQISAYSVLIADKQDELDHATERYETLNEEYKVRIRAMEEDGSLSYWEVLFKATSFSNLLDRLNMVKEIAESDSRRMQELSNAATEVEEARLSLTTEKEEIESARAELDSTQAELDEKRAEADAVIQELIAKGAEIEGMQAELEAEDEALLQQIAEKEKEYTQAKAAEWLAYLATMTTVPPTTVPTTTTGGNTGTNTGNTDTSGGNTTVPSGGTWLRPCSYIMISSPFGLRTSPTAGASSYHQGVDLAAPAGTPIVASRAGYVTSATYSGTAGYYVTINHGDGFSSIYMHMTNFVVSAGQSVAAGQVIGYVGSTGVSTGNHLHFGIAYNGAYVNPCIYVSL